jgi:hypothetical protein
LKAAQKQNELNFLDLIMSRLAFCRAKPALTPVSGIKAGLDKEFQKKSIFR